MKNYCHLFILHRSLRSSATETFNKIAYQYVKDTKVLPLRKITLKWYEELKKIEVTNLL